MAEIERQPLEIPAVIRGKAYLFAVIKMAASWTVVAFVWPDGRCVDLFYAVDELSARLEMKRQMQLIEFGKEV